MNRYRKGGNIRSVDEVLRQEFIYHINRLYHNGWFASWQTRFLKQEAERGRIFYAIREDVDVAEEFRESLKELRSNSTN